MSFVGTRPRVARILNALREGAKNGVRIVAARVAAIPASRRSVMKEL